MSRYLFYPILLLVLLVAGCAERIASLATPTRIPTPIATDLSEDANSASVVAPDEQQVALIPLAGPLAVRDAEISAMAWYRDALILVPQYPHKFGNALYALPKADILAFLDGALAGPLEPAPIPLDAGNLRQEIYRYQGFEAIAFVEDQVFLTIESGGARDTMSYLVGGTILSDVNTSPDVPELGRIVLNPSNVVQILPQAAMGNTGDETMVAAGDRLYTIYEGNGANINTLPVAHVYGTDLSAQGVVRFPNIEYRITDATAVDEQGNFWAINYFYPGDADKYQPLSPEPLREKYGAGASHENLMTVERLVEFHLGEDGITMTDQPPIQLFLLGGDLVLLGQAVGDQVSRNWEGIVRLDERGLLLATDKFPETLLGFVPLVGE